MCRWEISIADISLVAMRDSIFISQNQLKYIGESEADANCVYNEISFSHAYHRRWRLWNTTSSK